MVAVAIVVHVVGLLLVELVCVSSARRVVLVTVGQMVVVAHAVLVAVTTIVRMEDVSLWELRHFKQTEEENYFSNVF